MIRCEGSMPKSPLARGSLGAEPGGWPLSQIPYKNNIPRPLASPARRVPGLLIGLAGVHTSRLASVQFNTTEKVVQPIF
jgi:hypothetical protein